MKWILTNYMEQGFRTQPVLIKKENGFILKIEGEKRFYKHERSARQQVTYMKKTNNRNLWEKVK